MNPAIYIDQNSKIVILYKETLNGGAIEYIQHGKEVDLHQVRRDQFFARFELLESKKSVIDTAKLFLGLATTGTTVTPTARFALEQIICKPQHKEAPLPVPTTLPKTKKPEVKKPEVKKPSAIKAIDPLPTKEEALPFEPDTSAILSEAERIVSDAKQQAGDMINEVKEMYEAAKKKAEDKKALDAAKAEAKKILDAAKKETDKMKSQIKALLGKAPRVTKATDGVKTSRTRVDVTGKKIKKGAKDFTPRGDSARGALTETIINCATTDEALEYEGVNSSFILSLEAKGYIVLV